MDSDVIKQYVALGMGVELLASTAFEPERDPGLRAIKVEQPDKDSPRKAQKARKTHRVM